MIEQAASDNLSDNTAARPSDDDADTMKTKISATLDSDLANFLDDLPGASRSDKLERLVRDYRRVWLDLQLRRELAAQGNLPEDAETRAWHAVMAQAMWQP